MMVAVSISQLKLYTDVSDDDERHKHYLCDWHTRAYVFGRYDNASRVSSTDG